MLDKYKSIIFDCDGVILNSNRIKSKSFFSIAQKFGNKNAKALLEYHIENGGVSRNIKFKYFITDILKKRFSEKLYSELLDNYSVYVFDKLSDCEIADSLYKIRKKNKKKWYLVSGGNESEIKKIFQFKEIYNFFDGGIYGSPKSKDIIFNELIDNKKIEFPAIYFGDSKYDYDVAKKFNVDFIFIHEWTEFYEWEKFCILNNLKYAKNLKEVFYEH